MKAMASGCIPVTSRYRSSVLRASGSTIPTAANSSLHAGNRGDSITADFDFGPTVPYSDDLDYASWVRHHWLPSVLEALKQAGEPAEETFIENKCGESHHDPLLSLRKRMVDYAKREFSWDTSAHVLVDMAGLRNQS